MPQQAVTRPPISIDSEFTFGGVPCLVVTTTGARPTAWVYVIGDAGNAIRPLVDQGGQRVEFIGRASDDALQRAVGYLETRFGIRGPARHWGQSRSELHTWTVLHESPVFPGDDVRSLVR